jgi:hypothetical protein
MTDIHSCGYYCDKPLCIKAQRDELRDKLFAKEWQGLTDEEIKDMLDCGRPDLVNIKKAEAKLKEKNGG